MSLNIVSLDSVCYRYGIQVRTVYSALNNDLVLVVEARPWFECPCFGRGLDLESCVDNFCHHPKTLGPTTTAKVKLKAIIIN